MFQSRLPPTEMIILFGSYARGNWVDDVETGCFSDFDLLLVVATEVLANDVSLWANLTHRVRQLGGRALANLILHDIHDVNREIRVGHYSRRGLGAEWATREQG